jgi:aspartyl-tRNA(Asn)/glutamyl-tRNA(Gln) amidotransferase subunit B
MFESGKTAEQIVKEKNLVQISDEKLIADLVDKAIAENPNSVAEYKKGKAQALGYLVGQVMKATQGKANPQMVNNLLRAKIK